MQEVSKYRVMEQIIVWLSSLSLPVEGCDFEQEFFAHFAPLVHTPLCALFVPSFGESPLVFAQKEVYRNFFEGHLVILFSLLKEVWKRKKRVVTVKLESPLPWVTLFSIVGQKGPLGALTAFTRQPLPKEHKRYLAILSTLVGNILEHYLLVAKENAQNLRKGALARAWELHQGIAQEIAGVSLLATALRQHLVSSSKDRKSLKFLDAIDTSLKQGVLDVQAMLHEFCKSARKYSSFQEAFQEHLENRSSAALRIATWEPLLPLRIRRIFLEVAKKGEEATLKWSKEKRIKVKIGVYRGEAYLLFRGDGKGAQGFPFGPWHAGMLQEEVLKAGGRLRAYQGKKGGITIVVMVPAYVW